MAQASTSTPLDTFALGGNFTFTGAQITKLEANEYTLVTIAVDVTGSMSGFEALTRDMLVTAVQSCQRSPQSENLMVRVLLFSTAQPGYVNELYGFTPLADVDPTTFPQLSMNGGTPLYDAAYTGIAAANAYGKQLKDQDYLANAITFIITDGGESGCSKTTPKMVADEQKKAVLDELLESHISILIGIDTGSGASQDLASFQRDAQITQYIDAGRANRNTLAKLAAFISKSVSSQSQALNSGGPSQNIAPTI